jgi:metallo-beta-lactamase class B
MKRAILFTLALCLFGGASAFSQSTALPPPSKTPIYNPPYNNDPVKPFRMIGNIYFLGRRNYTSFLITTPAGHLILDTEGEQYVDEIRKNIEALGFHMKDVKYLLQTHAHSDHVGGLAGLKALTSAKVAVMAQDAEAVAAGREAPGTEDRSADAIAPVMEQDASVLEDGGRSDFRGDGSLIWKPVHPDMILHDGDKITLGGTTMVAHLTAGHTKGCTSWSMVTEDGGKKYNVVFVCSNRVNDGIPLVNNPKYPTVAADYAHGFETLAKLPCDVFLASHSYMFDLDGKLARMNQGAATNPFIDPQGYRQYIADYKNAFEQELKKEKAGAPPTPRPGSR